jgi:hypothetical protein
LLHCPSGIAFWRSSVTRALREASDALSVSGLSVHEHCSLLEDAASLENKRPLAVGKVN